MERYQVLTVSFKNEYPKYMHLAHRKLLGQYWQWCLCKRRWPLKKPIDSFFPAFFPLTLLFSMFQSSGGFSSERSSEFSVFSVPQRKEYSVVVVCYPRTPSRRTGVMWSELYYILKEDDMQSEMEPLWDVCKGTASTLLLDPCLPLKRLLPP